MDEEESNEFTEAITEEMQEGLDEAEENKK